MEICSQHWPQSAACIKLLMAWLKSRVVYNGHMCVHVYVCTFFVCAHVCVVSVSLSL